MPSHSLFEPAKNGSLGSQIFVLLRDRILNEEYDKGQKLNELALVRELNISRTPIREALKQLELEGLVESIPNKGVFVKGFSPRDIDDMFEIRKELESLAIGMAIERMDDIHLAKIKEVFELMESIQTNMIKIKSMISTFSIMKPYTVPHNQHTLNNYSKIFITMSL